jgi:transposase
MSTVAGIDVHKKMLAVVVSRDGQPEQEWLRVKYGTSLPDLELLAAWLAEVGAEEVVMESTAQYWKPVWMTLEYKEKFKLHLAQAHSNKARNGRKSDFTDTLRLIRRFRSGDLILSYVPEPEQRKWRMLTRGRQQMVKMHTAVRNQMEILLEQGNIKLSSVLSDLLGVSGRRILKALVEGKLTPGEMAQLAEKNVEASQEQLSAALMGRFDDDHRCLLKFQLEALELYERQILETDVRTAKVLQKHSEAIQRVSEIPGASVISAQMVIAELGPRAAAFPTAEDVASWVGTCPGRDETAGDNHNPRSPKGNRHMRRVLTEMAWGAVRTKGSFFQGWFQRSVQRLGPNQAIWGVANKLLKLIWKILHENVRYQEKGSKPDPKSQKRKELRMIRQLRRLGYSVAAPAKA